MSPVHFVFTCCLALTALVPASAEDYVPMRTEIPETLLVPVRNGWVLSFRNHQKSPTTPDRQIYRRKTGQGLLVWEITRTPNARCQRSSDLQCGDTIRVLSVPDGFLAVPDHYRVPEGGTISINIIPALLG